jgi:hypothetical protein
LPEDLPLLKEAQGEAIRQMQGEWEEWPGFVEAEKKARADFAAN